MKNGILLILLTGWLSFHATLTMAQDEQKGQNKMDKSLEQLREQMNNSRRTLDSLSAARDSYYRNMVKQNISRDTANMNRNLNSFMNSIRENQRRERNRMWIRFGFGGLMVVILVIGLIRRRKR
jgi:formate dehydrogenase maturation protein FdhE